MTYFKSLFINFLAIFFVNHFLPGIEVVRHTKLPHLEGELLFPFILALIQSLIFPLLHLFSLKPYYFKIGIISFLFSSSAYLLANILPVDITITGIGAYFWSILIVWFFSYLTNFLLAKKSMRKGEKNEDDLSS